MKRTIIISVLAFIAGLYSFKTFAQANTSRNDSIATAVRLKGLQSRKDKLEKEIMVEEGKRNSQIAGVSPETLETMNNRQDSICLALRSELVDVILEIKELSPDVATPQLLLQFNKLVNKKDEKLIEVEEDSRSTATSAQAESAEIG